MLQLANVCETVHNRCIFTLTLTKFFSERGNVQIRPQIALTALIFCV